MIQEIFPGAYVIEIGTGMVGARHLNYSFFRGAIDECSTLVDCGFPEKVGPSCGTVLREVIRTLGSRSDGLDVLVTHGHKDHLGQTRVLAAEEARTLVNPEDIDQSAILSTLLMDEAGRRRLFRLVGLETYGRETYGVFWQAADCFSEGYEGVWGFPYLPIRPSDCRRVGSHRLEVTVLPGHAREELGFLVWAQESIFSGDHILEKVAPIMSNIGGSPDALSSYIASLGEATARFSDCPFVPGHGTPSRDPHTAVKKTIRYYHRYCENLYHTARAMEEPLLLWDISAMACRHYQRPLMEKECEVCIQIWFKTYTYLKHPEEQEAFREEIKEGASCWQGLQ